ncbi:MAG TPA: hypothetical protein VLX28_15290, partial [Thermoanaerobaculia bacterium]|nr:hypothetical protein [Thermoanaerobaculia bacterium]
TAHVPPNVFADERRNRALRFPSARSAVLGSITHALFVVMANSYPAFISPEASPRISSRILAPWERWRPAGLQTPLFSREREQKQS